MQLFSGLEQSDYQDVLRALGLYLDQEGLRHIRIIEVGDGLIVQGVLVHGEDDQHVQSALLRDEQLRELLRQAYARRQSAQPLLDTPAPPLLTPVGEVLFRPGWGAINVTLHNHGSGPAHVVQAFARWRDLTLAGTTRTVEPGCPAPIVLERAGAEAESMLPEPDEGRLRLRVLYRDRTSNQYDLHAEYGHQQTGWRVTRIPTPRIRLGTPVPIRQPVPV